MLCRRYLPHVGGVERHVSELMSALRKRGYQLTVVTEQYLSTLPTEEEVGGIKVLRIPSKILTGKKGIWTWMLQNKKLFVEADVIHAHDVFWWYLPLRLVLPLKPIFTTFHGYENIEGPTWGAVLVRQASELLSWKILCIGDWMRKWYHHTPDAVSYGAGKAVLKPLPKTHNAIFVGRLDEDTGIFQYIEAIAKLNGKVKLSIYGSGKLEAKIKNKIGKTPYILFHGRTDNPGGEFAKHRFVFASQYLSMLEAQQVGRLVFAHLGSDLKTDYLKAFPTSSQVVFFKDSDELARKINEVLYKPELERKLIKTANKWAAKQTWEKLADQYEELWRK